VVGGLLAVACSLATIANFCVPSLVLSLLERRRAAAARV
jgi:hypothetical protein